MFFYLKKEIFLLICYGSYLYKVQFAKDIIEIRNDKEKRDIKIRNLKNFFYSNLIKTGELIDDLQFRLDHKKYGNECKNPKKNTLIMIGKLNDYQQKIVFQIMEKNPGIKERIIRFYSFSHIQTFFTSLFDLNNEIRLKNFISRFSLLLVSDINETQSLELVIKIFNFFKNNHMKIKIYINKNEIYSQKVYLKYFGGHFDNNILFVEFKHFCYTFFQMHSVTE
jgi:hypothetical protein